MTFEPLAARMRQHHRRWGDVIHSSTTEFYDSAKAMLEAERKAIRDEFPSFNVDIS